MAVEAHHLHLFPPQLVRSREIMNATENQSIVFDTQMGVFAPVPCNVPLIPFGATATDSILTYNHTPGAATAVAAPSLSRKRARDVMSFLGEDVSSHIQHQMQEMDRLIVHHAEKVRAEVMERQERFWRQALAAVEERALKRLKSKEEELERVGKMNCLLEDRVRSLCLEAQIWRDLAQTNEAAAGVLRTNLEQVLATQVRVKEEEELCEAAEDAESCCCGGGDGDGEDTAASDGANEMKRRRACRRCGEGEPSVLLLPCRHLCICAACGPAIDACPICKCCKAGSVNVNVV